MDRQALIARFLWAVDAFEPLALKGPRRLSVGEQDWPSTVCLIAPQEKYTNGELQALCEFADEHDAAYDKVFSYRKGCNLIVFDKCPDGRWLRKRLSWYIGPMYSPTLESALDFLRRRQARHADSEIEHQATSE